MDRSIPIAALLLNVALVVGCGRSNPPPASSAPAYKPPAVIEEPAKPSTDDASTREEETTGQTSSLTAPDEMPAEEKDALIDESPKTEAPADVAPEPGEKPDAQPSTDDAGAGDQATAAEPATPRRRSGKLLRRLGSSLGRAISKAVASAEAPDESRPAPDLKDDPFPNGEPADEKPKK